MSQTAPEIRLTRARGRPLEKVLRWLFFACAAISVLTTLAVVGVLSVETFYFFQQVPASDFLFGTRWTPLLEPKSYGILPLLFGTTLIVIGAAIVALPVGLACAIYLSEYAGNRTRDLVKPILEILAGIPTIVYGFFAITFVTPILRTLIPSTEVFNAASAGIVVGIMVLPMVASLDRKSTRLNSSHIQKSRMPSSA